VFDKDRITSD